MNCVHVMILPFTKNTKFLPVTYACRSIQGSIEYLEMHVDFEDVLLVAFVSISFAACDAFNNA